LFGLLHFVKKITFKSVKGWRRRLRRDDPYWSILSSFH